MAGPRQLLGNGPPSFAVLGSDAEPVSDPGPPTRSFSSLAVPNFETHPGITDLQPWEAMSTGQPPTNPTNSDLPSRLTTESEHSAPMLRGGTEVRMSPQIAQTFPSPRGGKQPRTWKVFV